MVQGVQLSRVEIAAVRLVADERVVLPAIPEAEHHVHELLGAAVAQAVLHVGVAAEVERLLLGPGGDDVPADPALADVVERGELTGDVIGIVVGRGRAGKEADPLGDGGERADEGQRFVHIDAGVVAELVVIPRGVAHSDAVGPEHEVDLGPLGGLRHLFPEPDIERRVRLGPRHAPPGGMRAVGNDVEAELHLPRLRQGALLRLRERIGGQVVRRVKRDVPRWPSSWPGLTRPSTRRGV